MFIYLSKITNPLLLVLMNLTIEEIAALILLAVTVIGFIGTFIARISKLETRADVCDEKHRENEQKHIKQDAVNLRIEEHHIEVMTAISAISTKLDMNIKKNAK